MQSLDENNNGNSIVLGTICTTFVGFFVMGIIYSIYNWESVEVLHIALGGSPLENKFDIPLAAIAIFFKCLLPAIPLSIATGFLKEKYKTDTISIVGIWLFTYLAIAFVVF